MPNDFFGIEKNIKNIEKMLENSYLKNRELMIKLSLDEGDVLIVKEWLKNYFQSVFERKINSF